MLRNILPVAALCFIVLATAPAKGFQIYINPEEGVALIVDDSGLVGGGSCSDMAQDLNRSSAQCFDRARQGAEKVRMMYDESFPSATLAWQNYGSYCESRRRYIESLIERCNNICKNRSASWFFQNAFGVPPFETSSRKSLYSYFEESQGRWKVGIACKQ